MYTYKMPTSIEVTEIYAYKYVAISRTCHTHHTSCIWSDVRTPTKRKKVSYTEVYVPAKSPVHTSVAPAVKKARKTRTPQLKGSLCV